MTRGLTRRCASNLGIEGSSEEEPFVDWPASDDAAEPLPPPLFKTGRTAGAFSFESTGPKFKLIFFVEKTVGTKTLEASERAVATATFAELALIAVSTGFGAGFRSFGFCALAEGIFVGCALGIATFVYPAPGAAGVVGAVGAVGTVGAVGAATRLRFAADWSSRSAASLARFVGSVVSFFAPDEVSSISLNGFCSFLVGLAVAVALTVGAAIFDGPAGFWLENANARAIFAVGFLADAAAAAAAPFLLTLFAALF